MINLTAKTAIITVTLIASIVLALFVPKVYLRNNIYYVSRDINVLYADYTSLKEENRFLRQQLEDMKFKNQIMDSLIINKIGEK